ncbi:MAG: double-strand break repair helicase AddA [Pseudomonadota bacterium]|nr:double-strand break repair helicase AddA [Pseudomonadota bacterium]
MSDAATAPKPDPDLIQRRAADPKASVWVAASAGSGKTKVLTDRVLALLVDGAAPDGLLCVTFTKAAASEMANRIHRRLSQWTRLSDAELENAIRRLDGGRVTPEKMNRARRLFAQVLDLPGGLRIRTIHSFCQSVLGRFPLEARVAPNFEAMDERQASEAMDLAQETVLRAALAGGPLGAALEQMTARAVESGFSDLMGEMSRRRAWLAETLRQCGGVDGAIASLYEALGAELGLDEGKIVAEACADGALDGAALRRVVAVLRDFGGKANEERWPVIEAWLNGGPETRIATFDRYFRAFITDKGTPNSRILVKKVVEASPDSAQAVTAEQERLLAVDARIRRQGTARASEALLRLGAAVLRAYEDYKRATARLDYDDLIQKTGALLTRDNVPWVLFKLDGGLSHLLIDEAQDTSGEQRRIVDALIGEFFSGDGEQRTLFVVGDAKQSIYSFQGADPEGYRAWRDSLSQTAESGGTTIRPVPMEVSFRSVQAVLDAVDATFAQPPASIGVVGPDEPPLRHYAFAKKAQLRGRVEAWTPTAPGDAAQIDPFAPPDATGTPGADATQILAAGLAATVRDWLNSGTLLESEGRPIRAGDILFLLQKRTELIDALVRELKRLDIPVAGVDRIALTEQIAVMDLLALARALLLPQDDLTLACVLKSPFVGFDDDDLFRIAHDRGSASLWQSLSRMRLDDPRFGAAADWFDGLLQATDRLPPYELFQRALLSPCPGPGRMAANEAVYTGRQALVARLGAEVEDPLEEFLSLALDHDVKRTPTLEGFLSWFARGNTELKRDLETEARDEIRIMTVHGAKGLQAPIVILPDALTKSGARSAPLRWLPRPQGGALPIWTPSARYEETVAAELKEAEKDAVEREYRRLLYVAMTRAESRLIVTGRRARQKPAEGNWYDLVTSGLERLKDTRQTAISPVPEWQAEALIYETGEAAAAAVVASETVTDSPGAPGWLTAPPPGEPSPPKPLAPSRPDTADPPVRSPLDDGDPLRFKRGTLVHRLLQTLPDLPPARRNDAAARYLAMPAHGLSAAQQAQLRDETFGVLEHPAFAPLFGPGSRAEVPLAGLIERAGESTGPFAVSGQVDRLLIRGNEILVLDYKTLRPAPADPERVPAAYLAQMAGYRAILRQIYPDRPIRCALVFTETPRLVPLPDTLMDAHA